MCWPTSTAPATPLVRLYDPACQHRTIPLEALSHDSKAEPVEAG